MEEEKKELKKKLPTKTATKKTPIKKEVEKTSPTKPSTKKSTNKKEPSKAVETKTAETKKSTTTNKTTTAKKTTVKAEPKVVKQEKKKETKKETQKKPSNSKTKKNVKKEKTNPVEKEGKNIKLLGYHDLEINGYIYENVESPKAVVLIVHGMQEHCLRYDSFAKYLNENGFIVLTTDLRGHGKTAVSKKYLGYGEKDIFYETLQDQLGLINYLNETYNLPIYLFGHSYGSMLSQNLIQITPIIEKCVLCGTTNGNSSTMKMGNFVVSCLSPFKKYNSKAGIVEKLGIKSYGKKFKNANWLTRDEKVFEEYLKDEYCGGSFPFSFYKSMTKHMTKANKGIEKIGSKKIFLIAGDKDPVGNCGKEVKKLYKLYLKNNINAKIKLYKDARHELINETNKKEIYKDIIDFLND